ncbi:tRNA lysidine(34) synthetase TilS [Algimonas porphyrae]|uniref:tRNA(Ile)-lysidine synthase n=1 Tax=Algimonas porphyrae TaxID=1128113 RepID=A0ABQ5V0N5_9PROT|nr:tRNA lysidine(34) synthetase TilS [Algimonas porphyrae]GLQ20195.1 hypothetical protein GCM10007854_11500 [Algimonas porphyrae]
MLSEAVRAHLATRLPDDAPHFALAYSGGGDSLSLLAALKDHPGLKAVLHVDHGLRDSSEREAAMAGLLASQYGWDVTVLTWHPYEPPKTGLQAKARRARYQLMGDYCRRHRLDHLVTAHHADDQAETVLMRLDRGSGWRGAAGMQSRRYGAVWPELAGITLVRPVLSISREALRASTQALSPIEDPSNRDIRFNRIRTRHYLASRPDVRADMLALSADMQAGLARDREHMRRQLRDYHLSHEGLLSVPRLIDAPTLAALAPIIGGQAGPPDRSRIAAHLTSLSAQSRLAIGHGCLAQWDGQRLTLSRDPVAMTGRQDGRQPPTAIRQEIGSAPIVWDGRFLLRGGGGIIQPERRGHHVGYRILYGRDVRIDNLVDRRLQALLHGSNPKDVSAT